MSSDILKEENRGHIVNKAKALISEWHTYKGQTEFKERAKAVEFELSNWVYENTDWDEENPFVGEAWSKEIDEIKIKLMRIDFYNVNN